MIRTQAARLALKLWDMVRVKVGLTRAANSASALVGAAEVQSGMTAARAAGGWTTRVVRVASAVSRA
ncbi:hypothetical protein ACN28C_09975 [Plantactinospora sp. WMMC1484]|uniref:hypothetical protein n=1 Tax=Plantactinospora sp. WMMC1484 TaxID=3404122 RepID=UPI003BF4D84F